MDNFDNKNIPEINPEDVVETVDKAAKIKKEIIEWVVTIAVALAIALILKTFFLTFARVQGESMMPTLRNSDMLYVNKFMYTPENGDVVIVNMEKMYGPEYKQQFHVKRVIAKEGDSLYIDNETSEVYVNGKVIDEPYINNPTYYNNDNPRVYCSYLAELAAEGKFSKENPLVLKEGEIFVMGDNRCNSLDSRANGPYTVDMIEGHALFRLWPLSDFGGFEKE